MEAEAAKFIGAGLATLGMIGAGIGVGTVFSGFLQGALRNPGAAISLGGVVALTALEFLVAFLQAFVFAVLTCVYLNDAVNAGHH